MRFIEKKPGRYTIVVEILLKQLVICIYLIEFKVLLGFIATIHHGGDRKPPRQRRPCV